MTINLEIFMATPGQELLFCRDGKLSASLYWSDYRPKALTTTCFNSDLEQNMLPQTPVIIKLKEGRETSIN